MKEIKALMISGATTLLALGVSMIQAKPDDKFGYIALGCGICLAYLREVAKKWDV